jgi:hypothetical protein
MTPKEELEIVIGFEDETRDKFPGEYEDMQEQIDLVLSIDKYMIVSYN